MLFDNLEWWDRKRGERGVQERGDICIPVGNVDVGHKPSQYCNGPLILKNVLFITGNYNAKVGSQEIPGVTGKFGLGVQNEAQQRLTEFCQDPLKNLPSSVSVSFFNLNFLLSNGNLQLFLWAPSFFISSVLLFY